MTVPPSQLRAPWLSVSIVFVLVSAAQLWLVAGAGTDIPFQDQWDVEGRWLYPSWRDGTFHLGDWLRPGNENRMVWTLGLNVVLFELNGQWDPLLQLVVHSFLRAACAAGLGWLLVRGWGSQGRVVVTVGVVVAFLPLAAWHNALWAIESHAYFVLGFSLWSFALLEPVPRTPGRTLAGLVVVGGALLAMSPGALVPCALIGLVGLRAVEARRCDGWLAGQAAGLLVVALMLRVSVSNHDVLHAGSAVEFLIALGRGLAWPHTGEPASAIPLNLPLLLVVVGRVLRRRLAAPGEDFVLLAGGWAVGIAVGMAWTRGGSPELAAGVPSRYVDFLVLLPLANAWCGCVLMREVSARWRSRARGAVVAWSIFLCIGWLGLSAQMLRGIVLPRFRDREAPVRLMQAFQRTDDAAVFAGQPRLLVPHPNLDSVRGVLKDPRMRGALPPSLQPDRPMGPLSRAVRWLLRR